MSTKINPLRLILAPLGPLAPAVKGRSVTQSLDPGSGNHAASSVSLHDNHNIEIKTVSELSAAPSVVETDFYLFVPKTFELTGEGKNELIKDFRSRIRLALPVGGEQGAMAYDDVLGRLRSQLEMLEGAERAGENVGDFNHALCEEVLDAAKDVSAILAETLKHRTGENARRFMLSQSLMTTPGQAIMGLERLTEEIRTTAEMMNRLRISIVTKVPSASAILTFLDEYMSQIYVQYLSSIRLEISKVQPPRLAENDFVYATARLDLEKTLDAYQEKEALHRVHIGAHAREDDTDLEREQRLVRMSHLKKFFQSKTFVDITRQQAAAKVSESTATFATAVAAAVAAAFEFYGRNAISNLAVQGLLLLCFGITVYVLRDRLKDRAKAFFQKKALQFFPDFEQTLMAKDRKIGKVKEWFRILKSKDLPLDVMALRRSAATTELEKRLPEEVFHCRKIQEVDSSELADIGKLANSRALYENTRVNLERYLKYMDDAFKELTELDPSGRFLLTRSHRVYYFYLCVKTMTGPLDRSVAGRLRSLPNSQGLRHVRNTQTLLYRIVLDKHGVVRIEDINL